MLSSTSPSFMSEATDSSVPKFINWLHSFDFMKSMCYVDLDYLQDSFNRVDIFKELGVAEQEIPCLINQILSNDYEDFLYDNDVQNVLVDLYGLMHARYILSFNGLEMMKNKYLRGIFGKCPRDLCDGQNCLPTGESPLLGVSTVKLFCPKCREIYHPKSRNELDGAYFGSSFPSAFLMQFPDLQPVSSVEKPVPRLFGFKVVPPTPDETKTLSDLSC